MPPSPLLVCIPVQTVFSIITQQQTARHLHPTSAFPLLVYSISNTTNCSAPNIQHAAFSSSRVYSISNTTNCSAPNIQHAAFSSSRVYSISNDKLLGTYHPTCRLLPLFSNANSNSQSCAVVSNTTNCSAPTIQHAAFYSSRVYSISNTTNCSAPNIQHAAFSSSRVYSSECKQLILNHVL
ncbi:hypothetical protein J6590_043123 [Homalodisca vitripennis]|nr:hypothetical protein J6590_043123 [Homalodisca vitripennis]